MKINQLDIVQNIDSVYHLDIGSVYVFDKFLVTEFNEGILLNSEKYKLLGTIIEDHFSHLETFGFVANRIHKYATTPTELIEVKKNMTSIPRTAYVYYDESTKKSSIFESTFCPYEAAFFDTLEKALHWVKAGSPSLAD